MLKNKLRDTSIVLADKLSLGILFVVTWYFALEPIFFHESLLSQHQLVIQDISIRNYIDTWMISFGSVVCGINLFALYLYYFYIVSKKPMYVHLVYVLYSIIFATMAVSILYQYTQGFFETMDPQKIAIDTGFVLVMLMLTTWRWVITASALSREA